MNVLSISPLQITTQKHDSVRMHVQLKLFHLGNVWRRSILVVCLVTRFPVLIKSLHDQMCDLGYLEVARRFSFTCKYKH